MVFGLDDLFFAAVGSVAGSIQSKNAARAAERAQSKLNFEEFARNNPDAVSNRYEVKFLKGKGYSRGPLLDSMTAYQRAFGVPKPVGYQTPLERAAAEFNDAVARSSFSAEPVGDFRSVFFPRKKKKRKKKKKKKK